MYQSEIDSIENFINSYELLWNYEILNSYPQVYEGNIEDWAKEIDSYDIEKKVNILNFKEKNISNSLQSFISEIIDLQYIKENYQLFSGKINTVKVKEKKRHEISMLLPHLPKSSLYLDFAGGCGHLSSEVSKNNKKVLCLDYDEKLIKKAKDLYKIDAKEFEIKENMNFPTPFNTCLIALHNCGELTDHVINFFLKKSENQALVNFGCCFHKSNLTYSKRLPLSNFAKTLAMRSSHTTTDLTQKRIQVKKFRYTFELLLKEYFNSDSTSVLLSSNPSTYQKDFEFYAKNQLTRMNLKANNHLNDFFQRKDIQYQVNRMTSLGFVRSLFSRLLEKNIILHRAKKLAKKSKVEIFQAFDFKKSPRNICVRAIKN